MVSIGSKALPFRRSKRYSVEGSIVSVEDNTYEEGLIRRRMGRRAMKKRASSDGVHRSTEVASRSMPDKTKKDRKFSKKNHTELLQTSFVRMQVDPETAKYFLEIENVFESREVDLEERSVICGSALEETRGKEVELATDNIISHTLQKLLEGCDVDHLCQFLRNCVKNVARIATDRCGSHVIETALKSLASHLQDEDFHSLIEESLTLICQAILLKPVDVMCNCYGSHVLRSLLCLCKGVPLDSEFHAAKSSTVLVRRLNLKEGRSPANDLTRVHLGFPDLLKSIVSEMLKCSETDIAILQVDQYSSLVLQTALRLLAGEDQELLSIIPVMLGCCVRNTDEGNFIEMPQVENIRDLIKENAFSHLMEIILEVAPGILYEDIFLKVFKNSLFKTACHQSSNFVVQALISHARSQSQMDAIWEELGSKFKDLLEIGRPGVIVSLVAASQRLHTHEHKCSKALAAAVSSENESPKCIVPRILFLESYFCCEDKSNWSWTSNSKMHVLGSLILQSVLKYPSELIQPYITSLTSMESGHVLETAKDAMGAHVIEAFLSSTASDKQKQKLIGKLKGHFRELSTYPSGSFTVEKCFNASDVPTREAIVSELLTIQKELSKTKQGPVLLRNLDFEGYSKRPEQWRARQKSKLSVYKDFLATFGSEETGSSRKKRSLPDNSKKATQQSDLKKMREEIGKTLDSLVSQEVTKGKPYISHNKHGRERAARTEKPLHQAPDGNTSKKKHKKHKGDANNSGDANAAGYQISSAGKKDKKRHRKDDAAKSSQKKLKT
ncbi:hypothetical protein Ancab_029281 [Ancistrocladus abbreviatus]